MKKYGLALHTSSSELGLALSNFAEDSRCQIWDLGRELSTHLHQHLSEFIQPQTWADLALIAVAKGPGSFTGTRIGVVAARTLAQQLELPLFAISTLAAVAWSHLRQDAIATKESTPIAVQLDAHRGEIFTAIYQVAPDGLGLMELLADTVMTPSAWQQTLENWPTPYQLVSASAALGTSVTSLLELADLDWQKGALPHWSEALPFYGQHPVEKSAIAPTR